MGRRQVGHDEIAAFARDKVNLQKEKVDEYRAQAPRLRANLESYRNTHRAKFLRALKLVQLTR
jgi:hypothetical protein